MKGLNGGRINIASCSLGAAQASLNLVLTLSICQNVTSFLDDP